MRGFILALLSKTKRTYKLHKWSEPGRTFWGVERKAYDKRRRWSTMSQVSNMLKWFVNIRLTTYLNILITILKTAIQFKYDKITCFFLKNLHQKCSVKCQLKRPDITITIIVGCIFGSSIVSWKTKTLFSRKCSSYVVMSPTESAGIHCCSLIIVVT